MRSKLSSSEIFRLGEIHESRRKTAFEDSKACFLRSVGIADNS